jgi:hypothetical protein
MIAFNLLRAAGAAAAAGPGDHLAVATITTLRARLIIVPARLARSARRLTLRLPRQWPWHEHWTRLADHTLRPAAPVAWIPRPRRARETPAVEDPERPGDHSPPRPDSASTIFEKIRPEARRWIRVQSSCPSRRRQRERSVLSCARPKGCRARGPGAASAASTTRRGESLSPSSATAAGPTPDRAAGC